MLSSISRGPGDGNLEEMDAQRRWKLRGKLFIIINMSGSIPTQEANSPKIHNFKKVKLFRELQFAPLHELGSEARAVPKVAA